MASRDAEAAAVGVAAAVAAAGEGTIRGTEEDGRRQEGRETDPGMSSGLKKHPSCFFPSPI